VSPRRVITPRPIRPTPDRAIGLARLSSRSGRTSVALLLLLSVALSGSARAYRPFDATDAAVAEQGDIEMEVGPVGFLKEGSGRFLIAPSLILNWGLAADWELVLEGRQFVQLGNSASGRRWAVEDAALSLKHVLREGVLQEKSGISIAAEMSALLPATDGEGGAGAELALIASQRWDALTLHLNGAASWTRTHTPGMFASLIAEGHDAWVVRPVAELFVEAERNAPTTISGLLGAIWRLRESFSIDAAVRLARAGPVSTTEIRAGFTWAFGIGFPTLRRKR